ncbi:MAG: hypothetical protein Q9184_008164 [Pyrenodesmia sp. 2 TL-2023]
MPPRPGAFGHGDPRDYPGGGNGGSLDHIFDDLSEVSSYTTAPEDWDRIDPSTDDEGFTDSSIGGPPRRGERGFMPEGQGGRHPGHPPMGGMQGHAGGRGGGMMPPGAAGGRQGGHHGGGPRQGAPPRAGQHGIAPWHQLFERIVPDVICAWPGSDHGPGSVCEDSHRQHLMHAARQLGYHGPPDPRNIEHSLDREGLAEVAYAIHQSLIHGGGRGGY